MISEWDELPETDRSAAHYGNRNKSQARIRNFKAMIERGNKAKLSERAADKARQRFVKVTLPKISFPDDKDC